jgi:RNA 2',3'-cyclic 3'-phosphodiesterase
MSSPPEAPRQRLFFALWPPTELVRPLAALVHRHAPPQVRRVPASNLHVTLAFVGAVIADTRACLEQAAASVRGEAFELLLERIGTWPGPGILWLAPDTCPPALQRLAMDLQQALQPCGYVPEQRPYQPHVTLARKLKGVVPGATISPLRWPVRDFVLAESVTGPAGPRYQVLARWPLAD